MELNEKQLGMKQRQPRRRGRPAKVLTPQREPASYEMHSRQAAWLMLENGFSPAYVAMHFNINIEVVLKWREMDCPMY
jgi:hypothetical protein